MFIIYIYDVHNIYTNVSQLLEIYIYMFKIYI